MYADRAALLSAIRKDPDDDTLRLAFADLLEEEAVRVRVKCPKCKAKRRVPYRSPGTRTVTGVVACRACDDDGRVDAFPDLEWAACIRAQVRGRPGSPDEPPAAALLGTKDLFDRVSWGLDSRPYQGSSAGLERGFVGVLALQRRHLKSDYLRRVFAVHPVTRVVVSSIEAWAPPHVLEPKAGYYTLATYAAHSEARERRSIVPMALESFISECPGVSRYYVVRGTWWSFKSAREASDVLSVAIVNFGRSLVELGRRPFPALT